MPAEIRPMTVEALGLTDQGVRIQTASDTAQMSCDLDRRSAICHAANVLSATGTARLDIDPDGTWHAVERSN